jgi:hypothetical protein
MEVTYLWAPGLMGSYHLRSARCLIMEALTVLKGSVALPLYTAAHPLYTRSTNICGALISEATVRSNPRC